MPAAVTSAVILLAALAIALLFARPVFVGFVALLVVVASWEVAGAFARKGLVVMLPPIYLGGIAMVLTGAFVSSFWVMASLSLTFCAIVIWRLASTKLESSAVMDILASVFVAVYIPFTASFVALISERSVSVWPVAFFVIIVVCNDLGGWMAGIMFGRHPMAPKLSPKKSWEGFAGSVILTTLAGVGSTFVLEIPWWWGILFGIFAAGLGTLGDLLESLIKREVGLKDMSAIVPGHGGLMDRLDSILFAAPAFYFLFALALGWMG
ncbi:phosphatidate cytidylyltransferase [Scrofimicrobium sp. R131]|uniref:Phosphatidate cytidylyltransferase n=1 Tax=Scrofimicrobium appendicitidis TaxID=3079930 RepID=A0AAU7V9G9_9ACTO